jgi:hypothetical protein
MREYGKVFSQIWESDDFRSLTEDGRTLVLYLLTCKHATITGVFRVPDGYACEDLQWSSERVSEGFRDLFAKGFATRCGASKWVWVTKFLEWNPPENPNQRKAAAKVALTVPDSCGWKREFMRVCGPLLGLEPPVDNQPLPNGSGTLVEPGTGTEAGTGAEPPSVGAPANPPAPPADPPLPSPPAAAAAATSKGSRLSEAWRLPKGWGDWALGEFPQWDAAKVRREGEAFRDHWVAKTGKDATKRDWEATWRNWCRSSIAHRDDPRGGAAVTPAESAAAGTRAAAMTRQMLDAQDAVPLARPETVAAARQRLGLKPTLEPAPVEGEAA